jgi:hypothetical protein
MKVDTQPFPNINMVEGYDRSTCRQLDFTLGINKAGHTSRQQSRRQEADSRDRPQKEERDYITEEQVRHVRNQRPVSSHLLRKYQYHYQQRLQHETEEKEYEQRTGKRLRRREDTWIIGIARSSCTAGIPVRKDYLPLKIAQSAILRKKIQEAPQFFSAWGQGSLTVNKTSRHVWWEIQKMEKIGVTDHVGALMGSTSLRSGGCSGYAAWKKPRPSTWKH